MNDVLSLQTSHAARNARCLSLSFPLSGHAIGRGGASFKGSAGKPSCMTTAAPLFFLSELEEMPM